MEWRRGWLSTFFGICLLGSLAHGAPPQGQSGVAIDPNAELLVALADDTTTMDPRMGMDSSRSNYIRQVFESLVDVDEQGQPKAGLALSWKAIDPHTWEFVLRRGVTFHNGEPFHADTVLFNLDRWYRRNLAAWGIDDVTAATSFENTHPEVKGWTKVDDYIVRISTSTPAPTLWDFIGREPLVPKDYTITHGVAGLNANPIGTGPWRVVEWKRKEHMLFERYEQYWGEIPLIKRLRFQIIPAGAARIAALKSGKVHLIEAVPPEDAPLLAQDARLQVRSSAHKLLCRLYLNGRMKEQYDSGGRDGLFVDPKVRFALNLAVDRAGIVKKIFHGYASINASPVSSVSYGYTPQEPYAYDLQRAKALLAEAGWRDSDGDGILDKAGQRLSLELLFPAKHYGQGFDEMTTVVVEMLQAVGMDVTIRPVDFGTLIETLQKGTLPPNGGFTACRTSNNVDADDYLRDWAAMHFMNWSPYPPELLALYQQTQQEVDGVRRLRLLADLQRQVRDWAPVIALYQEVKIYAYSQKVLGFRPLPELHMSLQGVALQQ